LGIQGVRRQLQAAYPAGSPPYGKAISGVAAHRALKSLSEEPMAGLSDTLESLWLTFALHKRDGKLRRSTFTQILNLKNIFVLYRLTMYS
jgi:hypothetical protein